MTRRVLLLQRRMPNYRMALFDRLAGKLAEHAVDLRVAYGRPVRQDLSRRDEGFLEAGFPVSCRNFQVAGLGAFHLDLPRELARGNDLVILPHENAVLPNFLALRRTYRDRSRFAFFGHGANLQERGEKFLRKSLKAWLAKQGGWYFAYTALSAARVIENRFPRDRITCLNNTVDALRLVQWRESVSPDETAALRRTLGIDGDHTAVFLGSLTQDRMLPLLFAAAVRLRAAFPDFQLLMVGDGPMRGRVREFVRGRPWARWVGARHGREKVLHALLGKVILNPGMVGLNIIDSFALGIPMVTTDCGIHSPEIIYLENGRNGCMTPVSLDGYVACAATLLRDDSRRAEIARNAMEDAGKYTLEQMVENFAGGILSAMEG